MSIDNKQLLKEISRLASLSCLKHIKFESRSSEECIFRLNYDLMHPLHFQSVSAQPNSPRSREVTQVSSPREVILLLALYRKYGEPKVWLRSSLPGLAMEEDAEVSVPLAVLQTHHPVYSLVRHIIEQVKPGQFPFEIDFEELYSLPTAQLAAVSASLLVFFRALVLIDNGTQPVYTSQRLLFFSVSNFSLSFQLPIQYSDCPPFTSDASSRPNESIEGCR
eukprot:gnl/Dysnectes_brevis/6752_a10713_400.p1 GENE.gnl/Dysnectes_brevis/6752_a10713_400~~gnl/Dysnectes_brevis/6752_a10713_400.p1  ORF type:complete len:221 (+),score=21.22 gnl/Dysnectes_brevis/6752_a10713_400:89-751(+)